MSTVWDTHEAKVKIGKIEKAGSFWYSATCHGIGSEYFEFDTFEQAKAKALELASKEIQSWEDDQ